MKASDRDMRWTPVADRMPQRDVEAAVRSTWSVSYRIVKTVDIIPQAPTLHEAEVQSK
jgi:hypothetical protein